MPSNKYSLTRIHSFAVIFFCCIGFSSARLHAQDYPNKPITLIVSFAPGGTADIVGRLLANTMSKFLKQPVLVENRAGAGGAIGVSAIAKAAADGYTLGIATVSAMSVNPACNNKLTYHPLKDFSFISNVIEVPNLLAINPNKTSAQTLDDLLKAAKNHPGKYTYATSGACGIHHIMGELLEDAATVKLNHIPYKGAGQSITEILSGKIDILFDNLITTLPYVNSGKLKVLAIAGEKRNEYLPNVPTFAEQGFASVGLNSWFGLIAPANLPNDINLKLHAAVLSTLAQPEVQEKIKTLGANPIGNDTTSFRKQVETELQRMQTLIKNKNISFTD